MTAEQLLADNWPMSLGKHFDGCCPCGKIIGDGFKVDFHCWRASCEHGCEYSGIHVEGTLPKETLEKIARQIRDNNGWTDRTDWTLTVNGEKIQ